MLTVPKSDCPDIWIRLPRHKWSKSWSNMEDPVVLLEQKFYGHPLAGLGRTLVGKAIYENSIEVRLGESSELGIRCKTSWKETQH